MKYTIINNNYKNFKVQYEIEGQPQYAELGAYRGMVYVRIARHTNIAINAYGKVMGDGQQLTQHLMSEEELFQESLVDPLTYQKKFAAELLTAFYNNESTMTVELFDMIANPSTTKTIAKPKTKKK